jgi:hypothetical protein
MKFTRIFRFRRLIGCLLIFGAALLLYYPEFNAVSAVSVSILSLKVEISHAFGILMLGMAVAIGGTYNSHTRTVRDTTIILDSETEKFDSVSAHFIDQEQKIGQLTG